MIRPNRAYAVLLPTLIAGCLAQRSAAGQTPALAAARASSTLTLESAFEGGSGVLVSADQQQRLLRITPTPHPDRGWACWWYVKICGIQPGETIGLEIDVPEAAALGRCRWPEACRAFAMPDRAVFSLDKKRWEQTAPGVRQNNRILYRQKIDAAEAYFAWGPPFVPSDAAELVRWAAQQCPHATAFELCRSQEDRPVPAVRIGPQAASGQPRYGVWIHARQHAWETGSSWVARGLVEWLVSDDAQAWSLRQKAAVVIVPIMDVDNVAIGAGGKGQWPHDHNRDWSDRPVFPAVAAAQREIRRLNDAGQFDFFLDLHNPGPGDREPFFNSPERTMGSEAAWTNVKRFVAGAAEEIVGPIRFRGMHRQTGPKYDPAMWQAMAEHWVNRHTAPHVVCLAMEIPWNTPQSTADGYRRVGQELGRAIERYFRTPPRN